MNAMIRLLFASLFFFLCDARCQSLSPSQAMNRYELDVPVAKNAFLESTYLLDVRQDSELSRQVSVLRRQSYETAYGDKVSFDPWFSTRWKDLRILWITQIDKKSGIIWGASTGERGKKYTIEPGLTLGFIHQMHLFTNAVLTFYGTTVIGGKLKEGTCEADYGEIGGEQTVNCRLAATTLAPAETLKYLMNEKPKKDMLLSVRLNIQF